MRGVILAGGTGSRLSPLTKVTNKHLLPVYDEPMIYKVIKTLTNSGITEITIVLGGESVGDFVRLLGDGSEFGANLSYVYQQKPGGIAEALFLVKNIINREKIAVILGDNIFEDIFEKEVKEFDKKGLGYGCKIFLKHVIHPEKFGVVEFKNDIIVNIEEKPENPKSHYAVTGLYFYDEYVFDYIEYQKEHIGYSDRGELEITDLNNLYLRDGNLDYSIVEGFWTDAGTIETLHNASNLIRKKKNGLWKS